MKYNSSNSSEKTNTSVNLTAEIIKVAEIIRQANRIFILTGAGISSESGIPTFRDKQKGLWEQYRAEDLASIHGFKKNPQLVWEWYQMRRRSIQSKKPNAAHYALYDLQQWFFSRGNSEEKTFTLASQNVDNLHEQAGSSPLKIHGDISKSHCNECGLLSIEEHTDIDDLLHCPECEGLMRPSVVWFGESLPASIWQEASTAAKKCDVFLSIGTSGQVYPAANLVRTAKKRGQAAIVEINPIPSIKKFNVIELADAAGRVLPEIVRKIQQT